MYAIENRLDFVSLDDESLQRRRKFVGERDFPLASEQQTYFRSSPAVRKLHFPIQNS